MDDTFDSDIEMCISETYQGTHLKCQLSELGIEIS